MKWLYVVSTMPSNSHICHTVGNIWAMHSPAYIPKLFFPQAFQFMQKIRFAVQLILRHFLLWPKLHLRICHPWILWMYNVNFIILIYACFDLKSFLEHFITRYLPDMALATLAKCNVFNNKGRKNIKLGIFFCLFCRRNSYQARTINTKLYKKGLFKIKPPGLVLVTWPNQVVLFPNVTKPLSEWKWNKVSM